MCMMKLATNTMTADSTMGIHKAVRGTMRSLPGMKFWMPCNVEYRDFPREATLDQGSSQEPGVKHPAEVLRTWSRRLPPQLQASAGVMMSPEDKNALQSTSTT